VKYKELLGETSLMEWNLLTQKSIFFMVGFNVNRDSLSLPPELSLSSLNQKTKNKKNEVLDQS
jgi:hypothetical protein